MPGRSHSPIIAEGMPVVFRDQTIYRNPNAFNESHMYEVDFDETCFSTFISNNDGVAVHEAYEGAIASIFGDQALEDFDLANRAPKDIVDELFEVNPQFIQEALAHAQQYFAHPEDVTDIGLGMIARFASRNEAVHDELSTRATTEMIVIRKKEILIPKIGYDWPEAVKGFPEAWTELNERRQKDSKWERVHLAIVSSGHTDFIQKVMEIAGLPHPDVYMTDDELRRQVTPKTKPNPYALQLVRNAWMNAYLVPKSYRRDREFMQDTKRRQAYIGDDIKKDGGMAKRDGIAFMHHDGRPDTWSRIVDSIVRNVESGEGIEDQI
jgi:phosphoglycolate phosphatase-like HAD superfamily hydrolase